MVYNRPVALIPQVLIWINYRKVYKIKTESDVNRDTRYKARHCKTKAKAVSGLDGKALANAET